MARNLPHIFLGLQADAYRYTSPLQGRDRFDVPQRESVATHGSRLLTQLSSAISEAADNKNPAKIRLGETGLAIKFTSEPNFLLRIQSLEKLRSGIELLNVRQVGEQTEATVFIPYAKQAIFKSLFEKYAASAQSDKISNKKLAESISEIHLATELRDFWTDSPELFPSDLNKRQFWEIWLKIGGDESPDPLLAKFRRALANTGVSLSKHKFRFPERLVLVATASVAELLKVPHLFESLAELRCVKNPDVFRFLSPKDQNQLVQEALERIIPPDISAPAVCLLDTGVAADHPLLSVAISTDDLLSYDDNWNPTDNPSQPHGTRMGGLALYGCLTTLLGSAEVWNLEHRLESVKILPNTGQNEPHLYADITEASVAKIEIAAPSRNRVFCLAVTEDQCENGLPSSWSAGIDQIAAGDQEMPRRLFLISAGNIRGDIHKSEYPERNFTEGIQSPAQSWNALTVGAYTEKVVITDSTLQDYLPIAEAGSLSPTSTTSYFWLEKQWPLKPDIVMEGGNAAESQSGDFDFPDELQLLTTQQSSTGGLLAIFNETSAAVAQAARFSSLIQAKYTEYWPETIRALLVHSADWTEKMLEQFPCSNQNSIEGRLRVYGYGTPNLEKALKSAQNSATLVVQDQLSPFYKDSVVKTNEMKVHHLPWPTQVLQDLGDIETSVKITLSYFIEPSPGRKGWEKKHRYQSHGLRFDLKRPTETDQEFVQRISREMRENDFESVSSERKWQLGKNLRTRGSLHSDSWTGTASDLAASGLVVVYPVVGWWKERQHLNRYDSKARYSLIITLETAAENVDIYVPIVQTVETMLSTQVAVPVS